MKKTALFVSLVLGFLAIVFSGAALKRADAAGNNPKAGHTVHVNSCQRCHGPQGRGDGPAGKLLKTKPADWTDKRKMSALSDNQLYAIISGGGGAIGKSTLMPAFKGKLSEAQIWDVIAFIRSL